MAVLNGVPTKVDGMESQYKSLFDVPTLSAATTAFAQQAVSAANPKVDACVTQTMDVVAAVAQDALMFQTFINLSTPTMEDGKEYDALLLVVRWFVWVVCWYTND